MYRIYIAGALSSKEKTGRDPSTVVTDYLKNVSAMCKAALTVRSLGAYPYVPALDLLLGIVAGNWDEEMYRDTSMAFLEVCDAVWVISWSNGVELEVTRAKELGIPVLMSESALNDLVMRF